MITFTDHNQPCLTGPAGSLRVLSEDEITLKLAMLIEGQCEGSGAAQAAGKFGYSKARYFQLLHLLQAQGALALQSKPTGPKSNYRRTDEIVRQIIRHRFLDPEASAQVIAQKLEQTHHALSIRSVRRVIADYGLQKKLCALNPKTPPLTILTQRTAQRRRAEPADPQSLERQVRQLLADKISGNQVGIWLLVPEHLRLGTWDLLCGWSQASPQELAPRLALQIIHEAALCRCNPRSGRTLSQKGFEVANGLPFVASDQAAHELLSARTVAQATPELLGLAQPILGLSAGCSEPPLVLADAEHYTEAIFDDLSPLPFDLLVPMKPTRQQQQRWRQLPPQAFQRHWAGYALAKPPCRFGSRDCFELVQRSGECADQYQFQGFLSSRDDELPEQLSTDFPQRWHVEESFKFNQALGWQRSGTLNLNIRYGQMTPALVAQAVIHQFRQRLGMPCQSWDAVHLARSIFRGLEGDARVQEDTILVTYYNAPNAALLQQHYQGLPEKLQAQGINPRVPWLYNFKPDFRFK